MKKLFLSVIIFTCFFINLAYSTNEIRVSLPYFKHTTIPLKTGATFLNIKEKTMSFWVAKQGIVMIQTGLLPLRLDEETTELTEILGQSWFWRARVSKTPIKKVSRIDIFLSQKATGPFIEHLVGYRYEA